MEGSGAIKRTARGKDGIDLYYEVRPPDGGPIGARPVVIFLHGVGGDADAWQFVGGDIVRRGYATITMDIRGHGHSTHPRDPEQYHMEHFVDDAIAILDQEKIGKAIFIGHCYGAVIALHAALLHPERMEKLIVLSGTYRPPEYIRNERWRSVAVKTINGLAHVSPPPIHPGHSYYPPGKVHSDYEFIGLVRTVMRNSWGSYLLTSRELITLDLMDKLQEIKVPTLVVVGERDSIFPAHISGAIHKGIAGSEFAVIPGGNHCIILNNAPQVIELISPFLPTVS